MVDPFALKSSRLRNYHNEAGSRNAVVHSNQQQSQLSTEKTSFKTIILPEFRRSKLNLRANSVCEQPKGRHKMRSPSFGGVDKDYFVTARGPE